MYANLRQALRDKKIAFRAVSAAIGCNEKSLNNKLAGRTDFTVGEAMIIKKDILPEFSFDYLFEKADTDQPA